MFKRISGLKLALLLLAISFLWGLPLVHASTVTTTHYLHYSPSVGTVNLINTQHQILNTTTDWSAATQTVSGTTNTAGTNYVNWYFYVYPTLAGTLTMNGAPVATLSLKANSSIADLTLITTINKISTGGSRTEITTKSTGTVSLGTSYASKTSTHGSVSTTVASGFMLELNVTLGGSSTANLTLTMAYDTNTYQSKLAIPCDDPLAVTLASSKSVYEWEQTMSLTATVTDVWGGYDISAAPTIAFTTPTGLSYTTTASSTGDTQYTNTYTYTYTGETWPGGPGATWQATSTVSDQTGNSYTSSTMSFELRDPGGVSWDDTEPYQWQPRDIDQSIIIAVIVILGLVVFVAYKSRKKRR